LPAAADVIEKSVETRASLLTQQQGKSLREARTEITNAARLLRYYAELEIAPVDGRDPVAG
jgi:acyl-CoA reductase-like NAD-dependent aldehyde dehydrogenase